MEKGSVAEMQLEVLKAFLNTRVTEVDEDNEDEEPDEIKGGALNAFLEAIAIIFEKCTTTEECTDAIERIQKALQIHN